MLKYIIGLLILLSFPASAEFGGGSAGASSGGIAGSTGATDNAILRANGTGGATLDASSVVTIGDNGQTLIDLNADVVGFRVQAHTSQTNPLLKIESSGGGQLLQITGGGNLQVGSGIIMTSSTITNGGNATVDFAGSSAGISFTTAAAVLGSAQYLFTSAVANSPIMGLKAHASQTSNQIEFRNSSNVVQGSVSASGVFVPKKVTADPCGDAVQYPEGGLWFNDTAKEHCTCVGGVDLRIKDYSTACF